MTERNKQLSEIFHLLGSMYQFSGEKLPFRAMAYQKASQVISALPEDISQYLERDELTDLPGIGESMAQDIEEFLHSGTVKRFEKLKRKVPYRLMHLMDINGFGPESLRKIHKELKLTTEEQVIQALEDGRIGQLRGFGQKKVDNMLRGLKLYKASEERMLLWQALETGEEIVEWLRLLPGVRNIELAGSLRRRKETIGDIDILIAADPKSRKKIVDEFTSAKYASKVLAKGTTRASILRKTTGKQIDLRLVNENEWGAALLYFTGSKEHNIHLRSIARNKGYKISEYGIFSIRKNKRVAGKTEEEIYQTLGMQWMPPEMREDRGEIDLARDHKIPRLLEPEDIRGDMQMHSTWSDGMYTLEEIVEFVRRHFTYDYIALTDHSKSSRIAGGMDEKGFLKQIEAIRQVNEKIGTDFLKSGAEVDILPDGSLDLSEEVLGQLDWVTASIHSGFKHDNTDRLVRTCQNPYVHCIGHPTGRLMGRRDPYPLDFASLIEAAKETHTALEINAQPERMDLNDELASRAKQAGVKLVISTDSHRLTDFHFMRLGVFVARRAWCTADDIVNTHSWSQVKRMISGKALVNM